MTPDERTLLSSFLRDLSAARGMAKDGEAESMIRDALQSNPDAAYALVQHAIVADQSLHAAQARIAQLEEATRNASSAAGVPATRFLPQGGGWSGGGGQAPGAYAPPPVQDRPGIFSGGGGLGSFLRSAGTTAAGVAGGEMLFSGLSDLFGGHRGGGGGFLGGGGQGFMGGGGPEEVIVNNYNDDGDRGGGDWDNGGSDGGGDRGDW